MANQKEVKVKVETEAKLQEVQALEERINELKRQKLQLDIKTNTEKLEEVKSRIESVKSELQTLQGKADVDDSEVKKLESELESLEGEKLDLQVSIEDSKLKSVESEIEGLDGTTIDVDVNNISAMEAVEQISQGFDRLKQGAGEVGQVMGDVLESAGRMEQTETFLSMNLGADQAKKKLEEIRSVTDTLPGDDVTLQNLLSQAALKDVQLGKEEFLQMGNAAADYMAAMQNFGKTSTETQQDLMNYILAGNTAEIERSPILQAHVDKLKEGKTVQERSKLLQEALTAEGWNGIASQEIYNNKLQQFNDMLERGKMNLGDMFLQGSEGALDFLMDLDQATGGLVGMAAAVGSFASPLTDTLLGVGQLATGLKSLQDLGVIKWFKDLEIVTKLSAAADWLLSGAQQVLNFVMYENPILLVVLALIALAAALIWAYNNVDWFREMVDNAWASLVQIGQIIYGYVIGAIQWLSNLFNNFTSQLGLNSNDWIQAVLGFILFLPTLPLQVGIALANALARALGFKGNFVQTLFSAASEAVTSFYNAVIGIPKALQACLDWAYNLVMSHPLVQALVWLGQQAVNAFSVLGLGQGSPGDIVGAMENELNWTKDVIQKSNLADDTASLGKGMSASFNPNLNAGSNGVISGSANSGDVIINVYGDVDSDKRVRQIVEVVRRELSWNNETAGRTV
ncbi:hypothetical protein [Methanobrevibacter sp.]|uniref:hypothetical protein n=1 Tax=Methanobrevibacter sp. TaxID=66852 RepID=UPI00388E0A61